MKNKNTCTATRHDFNLEVLMSENEPVVDIECHDNHYIAEWNCLVTQDQLAKLIREMVDDPSLYALSQSSVKLTEKTYIELFKVLELNDQIRYLSFDANNFGLTYYQEEDGEAHIEFESDYLHIELLGHFLSMTNPVAAIAAGKNFSSLKEILERHYPVIYSS